MIGDWFKHPSSIHFSVTSDESSHSSLLKVYTDSGEQIGQIIAINLTGLCSCFIAARRDNHLILRSVDNSAKLR